MLHFIANENPNQRWPLKALVWLEILVLFRPYFIQADDRWTGKAKC